MEYGEFRKYRPDIDGLRAVAVLSVIFFHVGFSGFSGGFTGVDIFFVISGFLITRNILADISSGKFSFTDFYIRRMCRLFPAMFVTMAAAFIAAVMLFSPQHLASLGKSILFSLASVSNFLFWSEAGYFDTSSLYKPLLHFWSLAVEEQFYLVWPTVLFSLSFITRKWIIPIFLLVSSAVSIYYTQKWLRYDPAGAYYLAPFRVVEFAIGAICVWLIQFRPKSKLIHELLTVIGLLAVLLPVFYYSKKTVFPGVSALVPCLGAGLLIYGGGAKFSGCFLNNPISVGMGLISYSAYLVHWPIIVFYKYWKISPLTNLEKISLVIASLAVSLLMFRYIEIPFKRTNIKKEYIRPKIFWPSVGALILLLLIPAVHTWLYNGWSWRLPHEIRAISENVIKKKAERFSLFHDKCGKKKEECMELSEGKLNIVVLGDSHGIDGYNTLITAYPDNNYILASEGGCPPYIDVSYSMDKSNPNREKCIKHNRFVFSEWEGIAKADLIVFSALMNKKSLPRIKKSIASVRKRTKAKIVVLGTPMVFTTDVPTLVVNYGRFVGLDSYINSFVNRGVYTTDSMFKNMNLGIGVKYLSQLDILCPEKKCKIFMNDEYDLLTYDKHHLSLGATQYLAECFRHRYEDISLFASDIP